MPVLNRDFTHLSEAIDSILGQSFTDYEFLIVDDGSNQETKDFLADYAAKDKRIIIITNPAIYLDISWANFEWHKFVRFVSLSQYQ